MKYGKACKDTSESVNTQQKGVMLNRLNQTLFQRHKKKNWIEELISTATDAGRTLISHMRGNNSGNNTDTIQTQSFSA